MKTTFDLDLELYRAIRVEAAQAERPVQDVVAEALSDWLEHNDEVADRASAAEALAEYERDGGVAAEGWFRQVR